MSPAPASASASATGAKKSAAPHKTGTAEPKKPRVSDEISEDALNAVVTRNVFYQDNYRNLIKIAIMEGVAVALLVVALTAVTFFNRPEPAYFATTNDGRIVPLIALNEPNVSRSALIGWVVQAVTETMTFGFHDWRERLGKSMRHFTPTGQESFTTALTDSGLLDAVQQKRQVISTSPKQSPVVIQEGVDPISRRYRWVLQVPVSMTIQSGNSIDSRQYRITVVIVRLSALESENGLGIEQWITEPL